VETAVKPIIKNDRILKALRREPVDCTPVWVMRQAGRYLPEYRETRQKAGNFMALCHDAELACEVTLQPLRRFTLDAAILFSDILTIPDAMGLGLYFETGEGPKFKKAIRTEADIKALSAPPAGSLDYVMNAVKTIISALNGSVPLLGFTGSPWTLATYMVEGGASSDFRFIKSMLYNQPEILSQLLGLLADTVAEYLLAQIREGVSAVQIFDTWGGLLPTTAYQAFSLHYTQQVVEQVKAKSDVPVILYTKHGGQWLELMADIGVDALSIDWTIPLASAQSRVGDRVALQGNLDPDVLLCGPDATRKAVEELLSARQYAEGHIFNLGHGISQHAQPDSVAALVEAVHSFSTK
jgi:uroporphyrinogen decarboxylase